VYFPTWSGREVYSRMCGGQGDVVVVEVMIYNPYMYIHVCMHIADTYMCVYMFTSICG
jgi:hypothetical protein